MSPSSTSHRYFGWWSALSTVSSRPHVLVDTGSPWNIYLGSVFTVLGAPHWYCWVVVCVVARGFQRGGAFLGGGYVGFFAWARFFARVCAGFSGVWGCDGFC